MMWGSRSTISHMVPPSCWAVVFVKDANVVAGVGSKQLATAVAAQQEEVDAKWHANDPGTSKQPANTAPLPANCAHRPAAEPNGQQYITTAFQISIASAIGISTRHAKFMS